MSAAATSARSSDRLRRPAPKGQHGQRRPADGNDDLPQDAQLARAIESEPLTIGDWSAPLHVSWGVREITQIGQNVNAYHGEGPDGKTWPLGRLLHRLAEIESRVVALERG